MGPLRITQAEAQDPFLGLGVVAATPALQHLDVTPLTLVQQLLHARGEGLLSPPFGQPEIPKGAARVSVAVVVRHSLQPLQSFVTQRRVRETAGDGEVPQTMGGRHPTAGAWSRPEV